MNDQMTRPTAEPRGLPVVSDDLINRLVDAFLCWRLPDDFAPDAGISFNPGPTQLMPGGWPTGTCLLNAPQAKAMFEHVFAFVLPPKQAPMPETPFTEWSLGEAQALVACFGGDNTSITVREFPVAGGKRDDGSTMEPGKYAWCTEYPEEGSSWLGPHDPDTEAFNVAPAPTPSEPGGEVEIPQDVQDAIEDLSDALEGFEPACCNSSFPINSAKSGLRAIVAFLKHRGRV